MLADVDRKSRTFLVFRDVAMKDPWRLDFRLFHIFTFPNARLKTW